MNYNDSDIMIINDSIAENKTYEKKHLFKKVIKRSIDIFAGIAGIIILLPLTLFVYISNKIKKENKKIFFVQERIGKNGKPFKLYKFQTMIDNADDVLEDYFKENEEAKKEWEEKKKLTNDPRVTPFGKILRKTSLDEFPQFINILKGDMSLVGPRPVVTDELELYGQKADKFLSVKPGLTGYWQANGRSNTTYDERIEMELFYVDNSSIYLDAKIIAKTIEAVVKKDGAI